MHLPPPFPSHVNALITQILTSFPPNPRSLRRSWWIGTVCPHSLATPHEGSPCRWKRVQETRPPQSDPALCPCSKLCLVSNRKRINGLPSPGAIVEWKNGSRTLYLKDMVFNNYGVLLVPMIVRLAHNGPGGGGRVGPCNWEGVSGTHAYRMLLPMTSTRGLCGGESSPALIRYGLWG